MLEDHSESYKYFKTIFNVAAQAILFNLTELSFSDNRGHMTFFEMMININSKYIKFIEIQR